VHVRNRVRLVMDTPSAHGPDPAEVATVETFSSARALEAIGERWSLLLFREALFHGTAHFEEFRRSSALSPEALEARLNGFVSAGLMERWREPGHPDADGYRLTQHGRNLEPVVIALTAWGDGWSTPQGPPIAFERDSPVARELRATLLSTPEGETPPPVLIEISVLGAFSVRVAATTVEAMSIGSQRLLVFLALHDRAVARIAMAGAMWPEASEEHAGFSLRSALSRLDTPTREAILSATAGLSLVDTVAVDLRDAQRLARRLLQPAQDRDDADLSPRATALLSSELLPDWYDDWVVAEAEDWRQLRMNALEAQARLLTEDGRLAEAAGAARAAMKVEPLRESAHACLIRVHLAEGNQSEALRVYERYRSLLSSVLGLEPTAHLSELVSSIRRGD
jgi:DNA-binding SARP family transcriptional activator/DNA-binding HxlR family transcriptional regulator